MRNLMVVAVCGMLMVSFGCYKDDAGKMHMGMKKKSDTTMEEPKKMSADACKHCPGDQVATADGKCPKCGAKAN